MEIRCKKEDCKHNTGCSCRASSIEIDRIHHCDSYVKNPIKQRLMQDNGNIFEVAEEMVPHHLKNIPLECVAKNCLYNKTELCHANGITVVEDSNCADCATFCES